MPLNFRCEVPKLTIFLFHVQMMANYYTTLLKKPSKRVQVCSAILTIRAGARTLLGRCIFIYSGSVRPISFEINFISKETSRIELEYKNIHPPIDVLAPALLTIGYLDTCKIFGHLFVYTIVVENRYDKLVCAKT